LRLDTVDIISASKRYGGKISRREKEVLTMNSSIVTLVTMVRGWGFRSEIGRRSNVYCLCVIPYVLSVGSDFSFDFIYALALSFLLGGKIRRRSRGLRCFRIKSGTVPAAVQLLSGDAWDLPPAFLLQCFIRASCGHPNTVQCNSRSSLSLILLFHRELFGLDSWD
jgi:hypothetical protein